MGMQDNPLVGDYTKGISKNSVEYFRNLQRSAGEYDSLVSFDLQNPLFAMLLAPVNPLDLDQEGRLKVAPETVKKVKNVDKSGDNRVSRVPSKWSKSVGLSDLKEALCIKENAGQ